MMESVKGLQERARRNIEVAEQVLVKTYPAVHDPKLILAVAGDVYAALMSSIEAILIDCGRDFSDDFGSRFIAFKRIAPAGGFDGSDIALVEDVHKIVSEHESSPVEFPRKDRFVICDERYCCDIISLSDMKNYLFRARLFVEKAERVLKQ
jgi:hypothetical protein